MKRQPHPRSSLRLGLLVLLALSNGCSREPIERRPPAAGPCTRMPCERPDPGGIIPRPNDAGSDDVDSGFDSSRGGARGSAGNGTAGSGGAAGHAGSGQSGAEGTGGASPVPSPPIRVEGQLRVALSSDLLTTIPLSNSRVRIRATGPDGATQETQTDTPAFALEVSGWPVRFSVEETNGGIELLTTIQRIDEPREELQLLVVARFVLEDIAFNLVAAPALNPQRGHALLSFVDRSGLPVSGVSVGAPAGAVVGYDLGIFYSDVTEATADRGSAVLLDLPTEPLPGSSRGIPWSWPGGQGEIELHTAAGAITLETIELEH